MRGNLRAYTLAIIGMDMAEPLFRSRPLFALRVAEHMVPARREVDFAGHQIPVPEAVVRASRRQGIALLALLKGLERCFERSFARFDLREHLVEGIHQQAGFSAGVDVGADRVVFAGRYVVRDSGQAHQGIRNEARQTQRNQKRGKNGEKKGKNRDLRVCKNLRAEIAQIEDQRNGADAFPAEKHSTEKRERITFKRGSVGTPRRKAESAWAALSAVFGKDAPLVVV